MGLLQAIVGHPMFSSNALMQQSSQDPTGGVPEFVISITRSAVAAEADALANNLNLRLPMNAFELCPAQDRLLFVRTAGPKP